MAARGTFTGLDCLARDGFTVLRGLRVGLVTHPAAVDGQLRSCADLLQRPDGVRLAALFGPEHGYSGQEQDLIHVGDARESALPCYSLYGTTVARLRPTAEQLHGLDALVIDLQDIGSRYYTFQATM